MLLCGIRSIAVAANRVHWCSVKSKGGPRRTKGIEAKEIECEKFEDETLCATVEGCAWFSSRLFTTCDGQCTMASSSAICIALFPGDDEFCPGNCTTYWRETLQGLQTCPVGLAAMSRLQPAGVLMRLIPCRVFANASATFIAGRTAPGVRATR